MLPDPANRSREPVTALPTRRLLAAIGLAGLAAAGSWAAAVAATGRADLIAAGAAGAGLVAVVSASSVLAIRPWKPRPMGDWTGPWLGGIVLRLLVTPALAWLVYSATPLSPVPLMLSVALAYMVVQISEAATVALYLKRVAWST